jgi:ribose transport system substrate-binding protein
MAVMVFALRLCIVVSVAVGLIGNGAARQEGKPTVAFISNNPFEFWTIAERGTEKARAEFNVNVEFRRPARGTAAEQKQIIEDLLAKGVKGIAISPNDAANQASFLNEVADKVPLITQDSDVPAGHKRLCYIGTNNFEAGRAAGELVKRAAPSGGKVVIFVGKLDVQNAVERRAGVIAALAGLNSLEDALRLGRQRYPIKLGNWVLADTRTDDAKQEKCKANAEDILVKHPDVKCLVGLWAYNPPAILAALKDNVQAGQVALVGFDEDEATLQGIKDGFIAGTIVQQPFEFGYQSIRLLASLARGDRSVLPQNGVLYVPHRIIDKNNVQAFHDELRKLKGK